MITLQEIFDTLAGGELSGIKLGNSLLGTIAEADYPKVVSAINLGLLDLHKKFPLRKGEYVVYQHPNVTSYLLRAERYAEVSEMDDWYYIANVDDIDFPNDLIKVTNIFNADGDGVPLNDNRFKNTGVFTTSFDTLKMTPQVPPIVLYVEYQAKYPKIVITESFNPETVELHIPDFIEEPLLFFVAARIFRGITSKANEGETTSAFTYHALYQAACLGITQNGLVTADDDSGDQFYQNGWV